MSTLTKSTLAASAFRLALAISAVSALASSAMAEGFDSYSDQQRLENQVIIASGNIGKRASAASYSNNTSYFDRQKETVFEIGRFCFKGLDSIDDISGKAGLLVVDQFSSASVGVITESISSIKIKMIGVTVLDCVSLMLQETNRIQKQVQQQLETLKQQRAILEQMLKEQRAATKKAP